ncbi:copia protein, partial [Tanacetum coccineum]
MRSLDRNEGSGEWDSLEYKDTVGSGGKKEPEALVFHKMYTEEDSDRDKEKNPNLDDLETLLDFDFDEEPQTETDLPPLVCKMGKGSRNKKKLIENIMYFNNGARPSLSFGTLLTQEEAEKRALAHRISMRLEGRINENALADTGSDTNTIPYRIYEQLGRDDIMKEERNKTMINYTEAEVTGRLVNVLCQVGFTTLSAKFLILEILVDRDAPIVIKKIRTTKSNTDDEEDYVIKRNEMGTPIHNSRPIGYRNNTNPAKNMTLSTLESIINPFRKISVWKKAISFQGSLLAKLRDVEWKPDYKMCYSNPELETGQWKTEIRLTDPYGNIYMQAFMTKPMKMKLSKYHKLSDIMSPN